MEKSAAEQVAGAHWRCHVLHLAGLLSPGARPAAFSPGPLFSFCSVSLSFRTLSPPPLLITIGNLMCYSCGNPEKVSLVIVSADFSVVFFFFFYLLR